MQTSGLFSLVRGQSRSYRYNRFNVLKLEGLFFLRANGISNYELIQTIICFCASAQHRKRFDRALHAIGKMIRMLVNDVSIQIIFAGLTQLPLSL